MTTFETFMGEFEQSKHQYQLVREYLQRDLSTAWERFAPAIEAVLAGGATQTQVEIVAALLWECRGRVEPRIDDGFSQWKPGEDPIVVGVCALLVKPWCLAVVRRGRASSGLALGFSGDGSFMYSIRSCGRSFQSPST